MKIIHVFWSFTIGGAETMVVDMVNEQIKDNTVTLIVINNHYSVELLNTLDSKTNVILLNRKPKSRIPIFVLQLNKTLLSIKPDVIHCHNYDLEKLLHSYFLKRTILTVHGFNRPISAKNRYSKVMAISNAINDDLIKKGLGNTTVIHNGIRTNQIQKKKSIRQIHKLVCIGRLVHEIKGQDILLKAFSKLENNVNQCKLYFIGSGSSEAYLRKLSEELNIANSVIFLGAKTRKELYSMIKDFDVLIQPSIHEGFGLTVAEAMVARIPAIISDATGLIEVTNNGRYAHVIKPNNPEKLLEILLELNNSLVSNKFEEALSEAEKYAESNFSIMNTCNRYLYWYYKIIECPLSVTNKTLP